MEAISRFSKVRTAENTQSIDVAQSILTFQDYYYRYIDLNSPGKGCLDVYWGLNASAHPCVKFCNPALLFFNVSG